MIEECTCRCHGATKLRHFAPCCEGRCVCGKWFRRGLAEHMKECKAVEESEHDLWGKIGTAALVFVALSAFAFLVFGKPVVAPHCPGPCDRDCRCVDQQQCRDGHCETVKPYPLP